MRVRILQLLCPQRHCMLAVAYETDSGEADPDKPAELERRMAAMGLEARPPCGICHSRKFHLEDHPTRFETMAEAKPVLEAVAEAQRMTAAFLKAAKN